MITIHQDIAEAARIQAELRHAAAQAALDAHMGHLVAHARHMLEEGGPCFAMQEGIIKMPGGAMLRFRGTLEIVE